MRIRFLLALILLTYVSPAWAQTPVPTLKWDYLAAQLATVQASTQVVKVDGIAVSGSPACLQSGPDVGCSLILPGLTSVRHTFDVSVSKDGIERVASRTIDLGSPSTGPPDPSGLRITITTTTTTTVQVSGR